MCSLEAMAVPTNGEVVETVGVMKLNSRGRIKAGEVYVRAVIEISGKVVRGKEGGRCRKVP